MSLQNTGEICPKSNQELLILALQELGNIEKVAANHGETLAFSIIFQHSQIALNALHDLKNALGNVTRNEGGAV